MELRIGRAVPAPPHPTNTAVKPLRQLRNAAVRSQLHFIFRRPDIGVVAAEIVAPEAIIFVYFLQSIRYTQKTPFSFSLIIDQHQPWDW
jgi:hypothetical protein